MVCRVHDIDFMIREADADTAVDLHVHGHAHAGSEQGVTPGGAPVRNVTLPVLNRAYAVYCLGGESPGCPE